jgi:hypothetical protein
MKKKIGAKLGQAFDNTVEPTIATLELVAPIAKAIPALGSTVEGAVESAKVILKYAQVSISSDIADESNSGNTVQGVRQNKAAAKQLAEDAKAWVTEIVNNLNSFETDPIQLDGLRDEVNVITKYVTC